MTDRVPNPPRYEARRIPREFVPHADGCTHGCFDTFTQQFDTECLASFAERSCQTRQATQPRVRERNLTMAHKELAPGQTSPLIRAMQYALNANGVACPTTGTWDDATTGALEAFQDGEALPVEPRCSRACWAALGPAT